MKFVIGVKPGYDRSTREFGGSFDSALPEKGAFIA